MSLLALERKVAKRGEGEQGVHDVPEGRHEGVLDERYAIDDTSLGGRHAPERRRYG